MKYFLLTSAAVALFGATTASACVHDSDGQKVLHSDGGHVSSAKNPCETILESSVLFGLNSAVLSPAGKAALDALDVSAVTSITGYASIEGDGEKNLALSLARAQAVADYLGSELSVIGGGETTQFGASLETNRVVVLS